MCLASPVALQVLPGRAVSGVFPRPVPSAGRASLGEVPLQASVQRSGGGCRQQALWWGATDMQHLATLSRELADLQTCQRAEPSL